MDTNQQQWNVDMKPMVNENVMQLFTQQIFSPLPHSPTVIHSPQPVLPANLTKPPHQWSKEEVGAWLAWCTEEFSINCISPETFNMNGRALCLLIRDDFMQRSPDAGDVLYNALQMFKRQMPMPILKPRNNGFTSPTPLQIQSPSFMLMTANQNVSPIATSNSSSPLLAAPLTSFVTTMPTSPLLPTTDSNLNNTSNHNTTSIVSSPVSSTDVDSVPSEVSSNHDPEEMDIHMEQEIPETELTDNRKLETISNKGSTGIKRDSDCRLLWEFIYHLLLNNEYSTYICWDNKERLIFRILNPHGLAKLWGNQKSRSTMTYEKLSRALRYYYKMEIIKKVPGQRLTYQFMQAPKDIKKGQRGARPHYKLEPFYANSCRPTQSVSEQTEINDQLYVTPALSTVARLNSNPNHGNVLPQLNGNSPMMPDSGSLIKTGSDFERLLSNGLKTDPGHYAFIPPRSQHSIDTNIKLPFVKSSSDCVQTSSSSPLASNDKTHDVLLKPSDIKTEKTFIPYSNGKGPVSQLPEYANTYPLSWTKPVIQEEPEDLSIGNRQRSPDVDTKIHPTSTDDS